MAESNSHKGGDNPNSVGKGLYFKTDGGVETSSDKVYRSVRGQAAIEDIHESGVVRNAQSAGVVKQSRWGERVFWSEGEDGKRHGVSDDSFLIEAPRRVATERQVRAEDITGVYANRGGRAVNLLDQRQERQEVRRSRGFSGEQAQVPKVKYRIGLLVSGILLYIAALCDLVELGLDAAGTLAAGVGVVAGYAKDAVVLFFFPAVFFLLGAPFWKGKKAAKKLISMGGAFVISLIPWVGAALPETFLSVLLTIYFTRKEDKEMVTDAVKQINEKIVRQKRQRQKIRRSAE